MKVMSKTFVGNSENICFTVIDNFNGVLSVRYKLLGILGYFYIVFNHSLVTVIFFVFIKKIIKIYFVNIYKKII